MLTFAGAIYFKKNQGHVVDRNILNSLSQQKNTFVGWVQKVDSKEGLLVIRRDKLQPFMPKREFVKITNLTQMREAGSEIKLEDIQIGSPVKITYSGDQIQKNIYLAELIEVVHKQ